MNHKKKKSIKIKAKEKVKDKNNKLNNNLKSIDEKVYEEDIFMVKDEEVYKKKLKKLEKLQRLLIKKYILIKFKEKLEKLNGSFKKVKLKNGDYINLKPKINNYIINFINSNSNAYSIIYKTMAPEIFKKFISDENNFNKSNKDNKINKSYMNGNTNENIENEIFNYIKNIKFFREELAFIINNEDI